jgi:hypothetical protein
MNESLPTPEPVAAKPWYQKEIVLFVGGSIVIAFLLVVIAMALYTSSGASQLDASRPGLKSVQSKIDQSDSFQAFSSDGQVTNDTLNQFKALYQKQVKSVSNAADFDSAALGDQALGIDEPSAGQ